MIQDKQNYMKVEDHDESSPNWKKDKVQQTRKNIGNYSPPP